MKLTKISLAGLAVALSTGCATLPQQLPIEKSSQIKSVDIFITHPDTTLSYGIDNGGAATTGAVVGGLLGLAIGAAIDKGRNAKWERNAGPIIEQVKDYDYSTELTKNLMAEFDNRNITTTLHTFNPGTTENKKEKITELVTSTDSDADIFVNYTHKVTLGYDLITNSFVELYLKNNIPEEGKNVKPDARKFGQQGTVTTKIPSKDPQEILKLLLEDDGEKMKIGLGKANVSLAKNIGNIVK